MNTPDLMQVNAGNWVVALAIVITGVLLASPLKSFLEKKAVRLESEDRDLLASFFMALARGLYSVALVVAIYVALNYLQVPGRWGGFLKIFSEILVAMGIGHALFLTVEIPCDWWKRKTQETESNLDNMLVPVVEGCIKVFIVVLVGVQIIQVASDKPITSIMAGLGIGGLAIALASQDTLKNLFGSIMLMCDRPFDIGDRIQVGGHDGPVKKVGLRSTTIENLDGHKITIPNSKLSDMFIQNLGVRPNIKRVLNIILHADTPHQKVEEAIEILRRNIENHEGMEEDFQPRVYLSDIKAEGFNILILYWYHPPAYWDFLAQCERYNLMIIKELQEAGIKFAMPVQKVLMEQDAQKG